MKILLDSDEIEHDVMVAAVEAMSLQALKCLLKSFPQTKITEEVIVAASSRNGEIMTLLLDHGQDLTITKEISESTLRYCELSALEVLLSRAGNCEITATDMSRAAERGDLAVFSLLLEYGGQRRITSDVLKQAAGFGKENIVRLLLEQSVELEINEEVIGSAAGCSYPPSGGAIMRILLEKGGKVTQRAVLKAARSGPQAVLEVLLEYGGKVSQQVMCEAARNYGDGGNIVKALTKRVGSASMLVDAFSKMMVMAAANSVDVVKILLGQESCKSIKIAEEVLLKANHISDNRILALLLEDGRDIDITEKALERLLKNLRFDATIQVLLQRADAIGTTQGMLAAAARNSSHGDEMLRLLLSRPNLPPLAEEIIKSEVAHETLGMEMIALLEKHYGRLDATDAVMKECAAHGSLATFEYIVAHSSVTSLSQEIFECCTRTGDLEVAQYILKQSKNIRITQDCIDAAAGNTYINMIRVLLREQPDGRITDESLKQAIERNPLAIATNLLLCVGGITRLSADVLMTMFSKPWDYMPGLPSLLGKVSEVEISEPLLEAAARDKSEDVGPFLEPFLDAAAKEFSESFRLLLSRNTQIKLTQRVLRAAAANPLLEEPTLNILFSSEAAIESITEEVQTIAARRVNLKFFKAISQVEGIAPTEVDWEEVAHLRIAVQKGNPETVSRLLHAHSNEIDILDLSGRTLLSIAAEIGHLKVVKLLLEARADSQSVANAESSDGRTPLSFAAENGHYEVAKLLLKAKADPNSKTRMGPSQGRTPLSWAVYEGHYDVVEILLDAGAEVDVVDSDGMSPLGYVGKWHCPYMEKLLMTGEMPEELSSFETKNRRNVGK
ncbi:MAG: hypothetical protein Q9225_006837 [Loekoesia sp. 1 TL-2023]